MKKLSFEELKKDLINEYNKFLDIDYLDERDADDLLDKANFDYLDEENNLEVYHVEFTKHGKAPYIYNFYIKTICDKEDNILSYEYYI